MSNSISIQGNIGRIDDLKIVGDKGTALLTFSVADSHYDWRSKQNVTIWRGVKCWGKAAEFLSSDLQKGQFVCVNGSEVPEEYENKEGDTVQRAYIVVRDKAQVQWDRSKHSAARVTEDASTTAPDDDIPF